MTQGTQQYSKADLEEITTTISKMLTQRNFFESRWVDFVKKHLWIKDTFAVMAKQKNLEDLFRKKNQNPREEACKIPFGERSSPSAELKKCSAWDKVLMQNYRGVRYGKVLTLSFKLPETCYSRERREWGVHIPNRFHFAEVSAGVYECVGFHYRN